MEVKENI